jgi:hypothetical protein
MPHGFTHRNDIPDITGMTPHQRWETNRIAADHSGYVRTDCPNCGATMCDCTDAQWVGRLSHHGHRSSPGGEVR